MQGTVTAYSRGYFNGKVTVDAKVAVRGTYRNGSFDVQLTDAQTGNTANGTLRLRGEYLVMNTKSSYRMVRRPEHHPRVAQCLQFSGK